MSSCIVMLYMSGTKEGYLSSSWSKDKMTSLVCLFRINLVNKLSLFLITMVET